jgi:hypothetical protein
MALYGRLPAMLTLCLVVSCLVFNSPQSARMLRHRQVDASLESSSTYVKHGSATQSSLGFGMRGGYGFSNRFNLYAHYQWINLQDIGDVNYHYLALEPKVGLIQNILAATVPIGFFAGRDVSATESVQVHPTLLVTIPVSQMVEANFAPKAIVFMPTFDYLLVLTAGLGFSVDLSRWALRAEFSMALNPETRALFISGGLGFSVILSLPSVAR